jgi:hypothetical protein
MRSRHVASTRVVAIPLMSTFLRSRSASGWSVVGALTLLILIAASLYLTMDGRTSALHNDAVAKGSYDLLYYFDIEPKEQKYLRMGTTYDIMVRRKGAAGAQHPTTQPHELAAARSKGALDEWERRLASSGRLGLLSLPTSEKTEHLQGDVSQALVTSAEAQAMRASLESLKIRQLRRMLRDKDAECSGCVERHHLVERILEVRGWLSRDDVDLMALAVLQDSAGTRPLPYHLGEVVQLPTEAAGALVQQQHYESLMRHQLDCSHLHHNNATVLCVPKAVGA